MLLVKKKLDPRPGAAVNVAPLPLTTTFTSLTEVGDDDNAVGLKIKAPAVNVTLAFSPRFMLHAVSEGTPAKQ